MPHFLAIFFLVLLLGSSSLGASRYLDAGSPATDREWRAADYKTLIQLLSEKKVPLPRLAEADGEKILRRFCSNENLSFGRNRTLPLPSRFEDFLVLQQGAGQMLKLYAAEAVRGEAVGGEMSLLLSFMLHTAAMGIGLVDEFLPTVAKDDSYQTRMDGLAQMKSGLATVLAGAYTSIADDQIYTDAQRSNMLAAVAATAKPFSSVLGDETKSEMINKFSRLKERFKSSDDQKHLKIITQTLENEADTGIRIKPGA